MPHSSTKQKNKKNCSPDTKVCNNCSTPESSEGTSKLSACARCGIAVYCSRDCQRAHWKANHKQHCVIKAERSPKQHHHQQPKSLDDDEALIDTDTGEECSICLDALTESTTCSLQCSHKFHILCVAELRKFGVTQICPLCRAPLPPGPEKLLLDAALRLRACYRLVQQGKAS